MVWFWCSYFLCGCQVFSFTLLVFPRWWGWCVLSYLLTHDVPPWLAHLFWCNLISSQYSEQWFLITNIQTSIFNFFYLYNMVHVNVVVWFACKILRLWFHSKVGGVWCCALISSGGVVFIANNLVIILMTKVFFINLFW